LSSSDEPNVDGDAIGETPPEKPAGKRRPPGDRASIQPVWDHWLQVSGRRAKLTPERRQKIRTRLRTYTPAELCTAIDGAHQQPFYLGENDRGTYYGHIETIFKSDTAVARHIEYATSAEAAPDGEGGGSGKGAAAGDFPWLAAYEAIGR
jgi:hypothetical protein